MKKILTQIVIFLILLLTIDFGLWLIAPIGDEYPSSMEVKLNMPGLKPVIQYSQIGYNIRSLSLSSLRSEKRGRRVLCLGASTTDQVTQDTQDTWCSHLERMLKKENLNFHTLSYGQGGDRAFDTAIWLQKMYESIKPDIVITLLGINDLAWNGGIGYESRMVGSRASQGSTGLMFRLRSTAKEMCLDYSQLCRRGRSAARSVSMLVNLQNGTAQDWVSSQGARLAYRQLPYEPEPYRKVDPIAEFRYSIHWMFSYLRNRGVQVIALGQPTLWKDQMSEAEVERLWFSVNTRQGPVRASSGWMLAEMQRFNHAQKLEAHAFGFTYLDLDDKLTKTLDNYFDDCHFTDIGSQSVATIIAPELRQALLQMP